MILRHRLFAKRYVTLCANEIWIFLATINFEIQGAAVIERLGDVTTIGAATRFYGHLQGLSIDGIEGGARRIMTIQTTQVGVHAPFVPKRARGNAVPPSIEHGPVWSHL